MGSYNSDTIFEKWKIFLCRRCINSCNLLYKPQTLHKCLLDKPVFKEHFFTGDKNAVMHLYRMTKNLECENGICSNLVVPNL